MSEAIGPGSVEAPAFMDEEELRPRTHVQREWCVQRGVKRFVRRAVAVQHEFASHDRGQARSGGEHIGEANRGIRRDWPDTELLWEVGASFRCELKAPGIIVKPESGQGRMVARLNALGHPADWANSVTMYAECARKAGVPLLPNWRFVANHEDELVAADIRKQEAKAAAKRNGTYRAPKRRVRVSPGRIAAAHKAGVWAR